MQVTFWGVRGSVPAPERTGWRYGGNTPCVEVRDNHGQLFILDAGTGIRDLGHQLLADFNTPGLQANLLLTHFHWDHIQGLPFFEPLYFQGNQINIFGPRPQADAPSSLAGVLHVLFRAPFFPVATTALKASYRLRELPWAGEFTLGETRIRTCRVNHPQGAMAYRLENRGASLVYATDHEPGDQECDYALRQLARGADLLITDAQYNPEELGAQKTGWGHGSWRAAAELARAAEVKNLVLFHHEPRRTDQEVDHSLFSARSLFPATYAAAEGMRLQVHRRALRVESLGRRLSQRAPVHWPVAVETTEDGAPSRDDARVENVSFQGAFFVSPRHYHLEQSVELAVPLPANGNGNGNSQRPDEFRLQGYVVRTEPQTTNGGWIGVGVIFPGSAPAHPVPGTSGRPKSDPDPKPN